MNFKKIDINYLFFYYLTKSSISFNNILFPFLGIVE